MYPSIPGGLPRVTPDGGDIIAGQFIPGGVSGVKIKLSNENVEGINAIYRPLLMCLSGPFTTIPVCLKILSNLSQKDG